MTTSSPQVHAMQIRSIKKKSILPSQIQLFTLVLFFHSFFLSLLSLSPAFFFFHSNYSSSFYFFSPFDVLAGFFSWAFDRVQERRGKRREEGEGEEGEEEDEEGGRMVLFLSLLNFLR